jgi:recombination protein RecR
MSKYPVDLITLIAYLKKLPGIGSKTAERFAFQLLSWPESQLQNLSLLLSTLKEKIINCPECGCLMDSQACSFCNKDKRDANSLCIIASAKDAYAIEETQAFRGLYHVLGGLLSPLDNRTPDCLQLPSLKKRIESLSVKEVIIALDSTLEGDATDLYLKDYLSSLGLSVSRLAFGLPMGSSLDYVDGSTLARALTGRNSF